MALITEIERAILRTLCYFDLFDYPLTISEIHQNIIGRQLSFQAIQNGIYNLKTLISSNEGFYFLPHKQNLVNTRKKRYLLADKKFKIALKNAKLLRHLPYIKAIFVVNKLAYSNSKDSGDIDFVIITQKNKIWTARFYSALLMKILNRRPRPNHTQNKICLSFFLTNDNLNLKPLAYPDDIHFAFWASQFVPIYDPENIYQKFYNENSWIKNYLPNWQPYLTNDHRLIQKKSFLQTILKWKFFWQEKLLKKIQLRIMPEQLKLLAQENNSNVILNDNILKMHLQDVRQDIQNQWQENCKKHIPNLQLTDFLSLIKK